MSDIFGAMVEKQQAADDDNWLMGEDICLQAGGICRQVGASQAVRSLANPFESGGIDWYPDLGNTESVHLKSGVGSLAFYLLANGGQRRMDKR